MTTNMINYRLTWTDTSGRPHTAASRYDRPSGEARKEQLEAEGCAKVALRPVKPGE
ncbi:hypothetical protein [Streptomyces spectabilis]|uniref:hypothetical protein n=1 Tax=Streptomyces spectabilis TaxID=68270 RepID=UPI001376DC31|nr:hypothetical protein [Streptomyces spectabilis]